MFDRRSFLKMSCGLWTGAVACQEKLAALATRAVPPDWDRVRTTFEERLAAYPQLKWLGLPREWSRVHAGFYPFTPERVLVLARENQLQPAWPHDQVRDKLRQRVREQRRTCGESVLSDEKFDLLAVITDRMSRFYGRPDLWESWTVQLGVREDLASSGLGRGLGLVHQFQQGTENILTTNGILDWWAFLFPQGVNFGSVDDKPVYVAFSFVIEDYRNVREIIPIVLFLNPFLGRIHSLQKPGEDPAEYWKQLARLDRISATHRLNEQLVRLDGIPASCGQ